MKVLLISAALVAAALCAAPAPPPGWTASGRLLLVPARLEAYPPPAEYPQTTAQPETNGTRVAQESESDESQSEKLLESGEYYVLLPDGRLQMVKYATAALTEEDGTSTGASKAQGNQGAQEGEQKFQAAYYIQAEQKEQAQYNDQGYKFEQPQFQPAYYIQAQKEQAQEGYKYEQPQAQTQAQEEQKTAQYKQQKFQPAYYIQAQKEQAQDNAQGYKYDQPQAQAQEEQKTAQYKQQKFQPAAYPVFIRPVAQESEAAQYKNSQSSDSKFQQVKQEPSNLQVELVQFPLQGSQQYSQTKLQLSEPQSAQVKVEEEGEVSGYEANVQYRDVKPISAPIYAYNPTPLVRILKK